MDEIIKILYESNKERKLLKSADVKKICYIILKKNNYNFVKHVEVMTRNPKDPTCAGVYYNEYIFFFYKQILEMLEEHFEEFTQRYTIDGANADIFNYLYLNIIFHELAHVRQYAIIDNKYNSIEKKIFSMSLNLSTNQDFYSENYQNILTEVNANVVSLMTTNYIYSKLPKHFITKNDWNVYQEYFLKRVLYDNYEIVSKREEVISPAERLLDKFDAGILFDLDKSLTECTHLIYDTNDLTLYKKLILGLPISYSEYAYVNLLKDQISCDDQINIVKKLQKKI